MEWSYIVDLFSGLSALTAHCLLSPPLSRIPPFLFIKKLKNSHPYSKLTKIPSIFERKMLKLDHQANAPETFAEG